MTIALGDQLRLQIEAAPIRNQITNHSGQLGDTTEWSSSAGVALSVETNHMQMPPSQWTDPETGNTYVLKAQLSAATTLGDYWSTVAFPCDAGEWVKAVGEIATNDNYAGNYPFVQLYLVFRDAAGAILTSNYGSNRQITQQYSGSWDTAQARQAPANTATVELRYRVSHDAARTVAHNYIQGIYFHRVALGITATAAELDELVEAGAAPYGSGYMQYSDGWWTELLGAGLSVQITRGARLEGVTDQLEPGTLTAVVTDATIDPATNKRIRPGRVLRCLAKTGVDANGDPTYVAVFTGQLTKADTSYGDKTRITLQAADAAARLANVPRPTVLSGNFAQRLDSIIGEFPIRTIVYDAEAATPTQYVKWFSAQQTALQALQVHRNTHFAGATFIDKRDQLVGYAASSPPSSSAAVTFSDQAADAGALFFTDITPTFSSSALVNSLTVNRLASEETDGAKTYGPYENRRSSREWGTFGASIDASPASASALAKKYLAQYAAPGVAVEDVTWNATDHVPDAAALELYQAARVKFSQAANFDQVQRIIGLEHVITPTRWSVVVRFRPLETQRPITVTTPAAGADTGPGDQTDPTTGQPAEQGDALHSRYRATDQLITTNTIQAVDFDSVDENRGGLTYDATNRRIVVDKEGRYAVQAQITWAGSSLGTNRQLRLSANGVLKRLVLMEKPPGQQPLDLAMTVYLKAGQYVQLLAYQDTGADLAVRGASDRRTGVSITYLGK